MAKNYMVEELQDGQRVSDAVFALSGMEIRTTRDNRPYLSLQFTDRTGSINGIVFDHDEIPTEYSIGDAVAVYGTVNRQYNNIQISDPRNIVRYTEELNPEDFLSTCERGVDEMNEELGELTGSIENGHLKSLLLGVFQDPKVEERFSRWPAAQKIHHPYIGGLLEHTLTVAQLCSRAAELYSVNRDLLVSGAILHDIGKLDEIDCGLTITYTEVGNLYGHSHLGAEFVGEKIRELEDFPEQLEKNVRHIILSHHGKPEWGATIQPMTLEAFLVFEMDYTDMKANRYQMLIEEQRPLEENVSGRDFFLDTRVYAPRQETRETED